MVRAGVEGTGRLRPGHCPNLPFGHSKDGEGGHSIGVVFVQAAHCRIRQSCALSLSKASNQQDGQSMSGGGATNSECETNSLGNALMAILTVQGDCAFASRSGILAARAERFLSNFDAGCSCRCPGVFFSPTQTLVSRLCRICAICSCQSGICSCHVLMFRLCAAIALQVTYLIFKVIWRPRQDSNLQPAP